MSATRDRNQKFTFVYSNFHEIYRRAKKVDGNPGAEPRPFSVRNEFAAAGSPASGKVIKAGDARAAQAIAPEMPKPEVREYSPIQIIGRRIPKPESIDIAKKLSPGQQLVSNPAIENLKQNLVRLQDLHSRLRFMLQELEDLVKE